MRAAGIVLAAGLSRRYRAAGGRAETKLVDIVAGEPMVRHAVRAALGSRAAPVLVVTGHARLAVAAALAGLPVELLHNADFASGLASSLRAGILALPPGAEAALVLLGDMPYVTGDLIDALIAAAEAAPHADAAVPVTQGERGNPVLLRRRLFAAVARLSGDEGARRLLRAPGVAVVEVPVAGDAARLDIDGPDGLPGPRPC